MIAVVRFRAPRAGVAALAVLAAAACGDTRRDPRPEATPAGNTSGGAPARADSRVSAPSARAETPTSGGRPESTASASSRASCAGVYLNVTLRAEALNAGTDAAGRERALRDAATRLLAPVRDRVGTPEISPAIRAFRVMVRDTSATTAIAGRLRASPDVENVARDECNVRIS